MPMSTLKTPETPLPPKIVAHGVDTLVLNIYYRNAAGKPCKEDIPHEMKEGDDCGSGTIWTRQFCRTSLRPWCLG